MDRVVVERKLDSLRRCLQRVRDKCPRDAGALRGDVDAQDILVLNISRAVQLSVDLASHLLADTRLPPPESMAQSFEQLVESGAIDKDVGQQLRRAVGFSNLAVHAYA